MKRILMALVVSGAMLGCGEKAAPPPKPTPVPEATPMPPEPVATPIVVVECVAVPGPGGRGQGWRGDCQVTGMCKLDPSGTYYGQCKTKIK